MAAGPAISEIRMAAAIGHFIEVSYDPKVQAFASALSLRPTERPLNDEFSFRLGTGLVCACSIVK
jgi:hypothetical protein